MQKKSNIYTILANTAVFLEIAALNMLSSSSSVQNFFITRNLQGLAGRFWGISESVSRYFSLPKENKALADLTLEQFKSISPVFEEDIYDAISMKTCVEKRVTIGAPGADAMKKVIEVYKKELNGEK